MQHAILRIALEIGVDCLGGWFSTNAMVATGTDAIWVKFNAADERLMRLAQALPAERFRLHGQWLVREGQQIAEAALPDLPWQPIAQVLQFQLPWFCEAGLATNLYSVAWSLERGGQERPLAGVKVAWRDLVAWVETAPQSRLNGLRYCLSQQNRTRVALVLGRPVPPVPAQYFVAIANVLIPAGMRWLPTMDVTNVQSSFQLVAHQWLLWEATEHWSVIDDSTFVALTRGSVRLADAEVVS